MREVIASETAPAGGVRIVGVLGGEPTDNVGIDIGDIPGFTGDLAMTRLLTIDGESVVLVGLGNELDFRGLRAAAGAAARAVPSPIPIATGLHTLDLDGSVAAVVSGLMLGSYRFDRYKSSGLEEFADAVLVGETPEEALEAASALARAVGRARDWVNTPPVDKAPEVLAEDMSAGLTEAGFVVEVWDEGRVIAERLGGVKAVAAGSDRPPRVVIGRRKAPEATAHLALVGKGIVFDSGGLSIKTAEGMERMKGDMAGAAAVVAAAEVIAAAGHPVDLTVIVLLTDNMTGGSASKPGDVLTARNGKTIEILNTDAEGRLILADGLALAAEENPDVIVDVATLTGACRVALGDSIAGLWASDDSTAASVLAASEAAGERLWAMPLPGDYRSLIESPVADMKNTGGRMGGAITAALLLAEFAGSGKWAHIDIAGPSWFFDDGPLGRKGGSGFGVGTLVALASMLSRS
ncbi:leucyl aminopeptidase [soil metagenome]